MSTHLPIDLFLQIRLAPADGLWLRLVATPEELLLVAEDTPFESLPIPPIPDEVLKCTLADLQYPPSRRRRQGISPAEVSEKAAEWWKLLGAWVLRRLDSMRQESVPPPEAWQGGFVRLNVTSLCLSAWVMPWEWLEEPLLAHLRQLLGPEARLCVARASVEHFTPPPLPVTGRLRLLATASTPEDDSPLDVDAELAPLRHKLTALDLRLCEAELQSLHHEMAGTQANILHFIGRTGVDGDDGYLILTSGSKGGKASHWAGPKGLAGLLLPSMRLACLSTCVTAPNHDTRGFARFALTAISSRDSALVPSMVYTQFPVSPEAAAVFWPVFYNSLADCGGDLYEAFAEARAQVRTGLPDTADWSSFVLLVVDTFKKNAGRPFMLLSGPPQQARPASIRRAPLPVGAPAHFSRGSMPLSTHGPETEMAGTGGRKTVPALRPEELQSFLAINLANQLQTHIIDYEQKGKTPTQEELFNSGRSLLTQAATGLGLHFLKNILSHLAPSAPPRDGVPQMEEPPPLTVGMTPCLKTMRSDLDQVKSYIRE